jgi:hypothetical protein
MAIRADRNLDHKLAPVKGNALIAPKSYVSLGRAGNTRPRRLRKDTRRPSLARQDWASLNGAPCTRFTRFAEGPAPMSHGPHANSVDCLFAQLPVEGSQLTGSPSKFVGLGSGTSESSLASPQQVVWPQPPPTIEDASDLQVAYLWLQNERRQLEQYTRIQFEMIEKQHQAMLAKHFRSEQMLALRSQELNREMQFLASQAEALQRRSRELTEREAVLAGQMERLACAQEELLGVERTGANVRQDTEPQRISLEMLRAGTAQLKAVDAAAQARFDTFEAQLKERQAAWEKKQSEMITRQAQMEERYKVLEKAEGAAKHRQAELDELENQIRKELEGQEEQLTRDRREVEQMRAQLRCRARELESNREVANPLLPHLRVPGGKKLMDSVAGPRILPENKE